MVQLIIFFVILIGLYKRALLLKKCGKSSGNSFHVPLSFLLRFFNLPFFYPQKRVVEVSMEMFPSSKIFIKDDSDTSEYETYLENAKLSLTYYKLETNVRNSWYSLVNSEKLERVIPVDKIRHYTLQSGSSVSCEWESRCMFGLGR